MNVEKKMRRVSQLLKKAMKITTELPVGVRFKTELPTRTMDAGTSGDLHELIHRASKLASKKITYP